MTPEPGKHAFESSIEFDSNRVRAVAVYCSDGRFGDQVDDLLHTHLKLPRYDRLVVPGGSACLAGHFETYREEEGLLEELSFLLKVHQVQQVVLIAHDGCAFYSERLRVSPLQRETKQREDMQKAIRRVKQLDWDLKIKAYFARLAGTKVRFEEFEA
jgi:hypothetical protein